jgi:hypothetical protein
MRLGVSLLEKHNICLVENGVESLDPELRIKSCGGASVRNRGVAGLLVAFKTHC